MRPLRLFPFFAFGSIALFNALSTSFAQPSAAPNLLRVGITPGGHEQSHVQIFDSTRQALENRFGKDKVSFQVIHVDKLTQLIERNEVNFFISTAGMSRRMIPRGSKDLLTITTKRFPDPNHSYGAVFLARTASGYRTIADLQGTTLIANRPGGFFGYIVPMGEIAAQGFNPEKFFARKIFLDAGSFRIIDELLAGKGDVATVPSCFLEDNFPKGHRVWSELRIVGDKGISTPCARSTDDYPNWTLSTAPGTPPELSREIVRVLLAMPDDGTEVRWSIATDFAQTDRLYQHLRSGVYEILRTWDLRRLLEDYLPWVIMFAVLLLILAFNNLILKNLVARRTRELSQLHNREIALEKLARQSEERFESLQKFGIVGYMSSMIAHELRQPLSSIIAYARGLTNMTQAGRMDPGILSEVLDKITSQANRAEAIVERVRQYAKAKSVVKQQMPLLPVIQKAIDTFKLSARFSGRVELTVDTHAADCTGLISPMEIELAVHNLLRNASDALATSHVHQPTICVAVSALARDTTRSCRITVADNGILLSASDIERMQQPLESSKPDGLGIGLSLVRTIVENHGGKMEFRAVPAGGLAVTLILPLGACHG